MTELEFRQDKAAVAALNEYLSSSNGLKFLAVIEGESILNHLSSKENQTKQGVRDLPAVETGSADNLLGRCIGYNLVALMIKNMRTNAGTIADLKPGRASRVAAKMREGTDPAE